MAVVAGLLARDMVLGLAGGDYSVVTGGTGPLYLEVIHPGRGCPQGRAMAGLAHVGALDMGVALAGGRYTVVTAGAITRDTHVIKIRR